jgi:hypothetical protein
MALNPDAIRSPKNLSLSNSNSISPTSVRSPQGQGGNANASNLMGNKELARRAIPPSAMLKVDMPTFQKHSSQSSRSYDSSNASSGAPTPAAGGANGLNHSNNNSNGNSKSNPQSLGFGLLRTGSGMSLRSALSSNPSTTPNYRGGGGSAKNPISNTSNSPGKQPLLQRRNPSFVGSVFSRLRGDEAKGVGDSTTYVSGSSHRRGGSKPDDDRPAEFREITEPEEKSSSSDSDSGGDDHEPTVPKAVYDKDGNLVDVEMTAENDEEDGEDCCASCERRCSTLRRKPRKAPCLESSSLFIFSGDNAFRILLYNIIHSKVFEGFVILVILMNSVVLALDDPTTDTQEKWQDGFELFFLVAFSFEAFLKILVFGFILHKGAYLRNPWNILDFIVVVLSYLPFIVDIGNYSAIRSLRVLRPLRSMNAIPPLKVIVEGLFHSVKGLVNVMLLMGIVFLVFGIFGVQLWQGNFRYRCQNIYTNVTLESYFCTDQVPTWSSIRGRECPDDYQCVPWHNPNYGITSFDHIGAAFLIIIQCITVEGWGLIMFTTMDVWGWFASFYFILLLLIGNYIVLNLALAVINSEFTEARERLMLEQEAQIKEEVLVQARAELVHQRMERRASAADGIGTLHEHEDLHKAVDQVGPANAGKDFDEDKRDECESLLESEPDPEVNEEVIDYQAQFDAKSAVTLHSRPDNASDSSLQRSRTNNFLLTPTTAGIPVPAPVQRKEWTCGRILRKARRAVFFLVDGDPQLYGDVNQVTTLFTKLIVFCIFCNTAILAAEYYGQSDTQDKVNIYSNLVFSCIFAIEMLLKLFALNPLRYFKDGFNCLDAFVVAIAFIEVGVSGGLSKGKFAVFRAFRLLRVFKLLKNVPSLRIIVDVMLRAIRDTGYLNIIILLYLYIAAVLGMQLFGGVMRQGEDPNNPQRSTFDSFYSSFLTVFQILTRDNWPQLMWLAMNNTTPAAALYFLGCVILGDFIILNLFLAILISSFDRVSDTEEEEEGEIPTNLVLLNDRGPTKTVTMMNANFQSKLLTNPNVHTTETKKVFPPPALQSTSMRETISGADPTAAVDDRDNKGKPNARSAEETPSEVDLLLSGSIRETDLCPNCHCPYEVPFPTASRLIKPKTPEQLHHRMCENVQRRNARAKVLRELVEKYCGWGDEGVEDFSDVDSEGGDSNNENNQSTLDVTVTDLERKHWKDSGRRRINENRSGSYKSKSERYPSALGPQDSPRFPESKSIDLKGPKNGDINCQGFSAQLPSSKTMWPSSFLYERGPRKRNRPVKPTPRRVEEAFGSAWEVGLLLSQDMESYFNIKTWDPFRLLLIDEARLLDLRVGEEQVGRALVAYTSANFPTELQTNGGVSMFIFGPRNKFRILCTNLVSDPWFDRIILFLILVSSILMALDNPREDGTLFNNVLEWIGDGLLVIFIIEAILKIVAYGFVAHPTSYLRDSWNVLDFFVIIVSIASFILSTIGYSGLGFITVLRTFRALRPLRVINRNRGIKMVVQTLLMSIKGIAHVALITLLIYLVFAILGVQLFSGNLYSCTDPTVILRIACTGPFLQNVTVEETRLTSFVRPDGRVGNESVRTGKLIIVSTPAIRQWVTPALNFDNTWNSFVTLFSVATLDNWNDVMFSVIDQTGENSAPQRDSEPWWGLFFVVFIIVGSFFLLNMFVGVIIFNFNMVKNRLDGLSLLSAEQKLWVETQRMIMNFSPSVKLKPSENSIRRWCFMVCIDPVFEVGTGAIIFANIVFMCLSHADQEPIWNSIDFYSNFVFVGIFTVEAMLKFTAFGWRYFGDGWNRFDLFIILSSYADIGAGDYVNLNVAVLRVLRLFRLARMLSLVKRAKNVRILLETLWYSLPSLGNIGAFLLLIFFVFSVLGMQIFATVKRTGAMNHHLNFESFPNAFLVLVQVATLDNWTDLMLALTNTGDCGPEDCGTPFAPLFFIAFILVAGFVMVNLFIAIILDNFSTTMQLEKSALKISDLKKFADAWAIYDEDASWLVETKHFPIILAQLKPPLGIIRRCDRIALLMLADSYNIPEHGGVIHFAETLIPLARKVQGVYFSEEDLRDHEDRWKEEFPELNDLTLLRYRQKRVTVAQYLGATYIQAAYRRSTALKRVERLWDEKYAAILAEFERARVPEAQRDVLHRMAEQKRARSEKNLARSALAAEYVQRERSRTFLRASLMEVQSAGTDSGPNGSEGYHLGGSQLEQSSNLSSSALPFASGNPGLGGAWFGLGGSINRSHFCPDQFNLDVSSDNGGAVLTRQARAASNAAGPPLMAASSSDLGANSGRRQTLTAAGSDDPNFGVLAIALARSTADRCPHE